MGLSSRDTDLEKRTKKPTASDRDKAVKRIFDDIVRTANKNEDAVKRLTDIMPAVKRLMKTGVFSQEQAEAIVSELVLLDEASYKAQLKKMF